ncbi:glycerophosphodiester phosphodiesterase [Caldibacillus debilis]|jgi:glycerophosphoryl diester phosphodiesterase|uniref:Glycerophosphoryl diester phosphodiesterase n=1 Tax=Caldibacillus debilis GB1 TaxID=1339248 RepID=A0A420VET9_9BACI|nr:glycerophosphodiester phosphodiesterase [Caldibacillus debilis]RKO62040.1 Glycerophosphoryl diester phosphodiesterase [Caldibacillus debilis GB1]
MSLIFAHRGASGTHPENTMLSFYEAERVKADGIELDVQLTKDGEVVIIHDETVDRTTDGKGKVKDFTLSEIKKLNAAHHFQKGRLKAEIPTLEEFMEWFVKTDLVCNIELKTYTVENNELENKVLDLIKKFRAEDRIILSSFNHYSIYYCRLRAPEIEIAPLFMEGLYQPWAYAKGIRAEGIHPYHKACPTQLVIQSQENGIKVRPFTVNKEKDLIRFFQAGAEAVITDYPERARRLRESLGL